MLKGKIGFLLNRGKGGGRHGGQGNQGKGGEGKSFDNSEMVNVVNARAAVAPSKKII